MMRQQPKITTVFKETKTKIPNSIYSKVLGTAALQLQRGSAASLSHGSCTDTPSPAALLAVQNDFLCPRSRAGSLQGAEHCSPLSCSMSVGAQSSAAAGIQSLLLPHALFCTAAALLWLPFQIPTTSVSQSSLQADLSLQPLGKAPSIRLFLREHQTKLCEACAMGALCQGIWTSCTETEQYLQSLSACCSLPAIKRCLALSYA